MGRKFLEASRKFLVILLFSLVPTNETSMQTILKQKESSHNSETETMCETSMDSLASLNLCICLWQWLTLKSEKVGNNSPMLEANLDEVNRQLLEALTDLKAKPNSCDILTSLIADYFSSNIRNPNLSPQVARRLLEYISPHATDSPPPLSKHVIWVNKLEKLPVDPCYICCEDYSANLSICKRLSCGHIFHAYCIDTWLNRNCTCPVCRYEVNNSEDEDIFSTFEEDKVVAEDDKTLGSNPYAKTANITEQVGPNQLFDDLLNASWGEMESATHNFAYTFDPNSKQM